MDRFLSGSCRTCSGGCATDQDAEFKVSDSFQRFNQKNVIFSRSWWDASVRSPETENFYESYRRPLEEWRHVEGYHQKDFALRNAGWHVADFFAERLESENRREGFLDFLTAHRVGASERREDAVPEEIAREIKKVAKLFGADLVGITYQDERWVYSHKYIRATEDAVPMDLPEGLTTVVVVCHGMDHDLLRTVPSALSGTATSLGYSDDVVTLLALAQYIRNLGYRAYASMNDTASSIPFAIKAGLGEYGRHGMLITPEFGPRIRIGKVFTDLELSHDRPTRFGVKEFCDVCRRCSDACPPEAIAKEDASEIVHNQSNIRRVEKWTTDAEKCFGFWATQMTDCSICVRVCPYKPRLSSLAQQDSGSSHELVPERLDVEAGQAFWPEGTERRRNGGGNSMSKIVMRVLGILWLSSLSLISAEERRAMTVDDLLDMVRIDDVLMTPDGSKVFYTERRLNWETNKFEKSLFAVPCRRRRSGAFCAQRWWGGIPHLTRRKIPVHAAGSRRDAPALSHALGRR